MAIEEQDLYSLCKSEMEYRNKLLEKYANILVRSEGRVDNINHMIGDLLKLSSDCGTRFSEEQKHVRELTSMLQERDVRIKELEHRLDDEHKRYQDMVDRYITNNVKVNSNNFNLK